MSKEKVEAVQHQLNQLVAYHIQAVLIAIEDQVEGEPKQLKLREILKTLHQLLNNHLADFLDGLNETNIRKRVSILQKHYDLALERAHVDYYFIVHSSQKERSLWQALFSCRMLSDLFSIISSFIANHTPFFFKTDKGKNENLILTMTHAIHEELCQLINQNPHVFGQFTWPSEQQHDIEWATAFKFLAPNGVILPNGTKLRRKDHPDSLTHSFIVVGGQILAMAGFGHYLGRGKSRKVKLAQSYEGELYALKISTFKPEDHAPMYLEADIAYDLNKSLPGTQRQSHHDTKKYIAYHYYFGKSLYTYLLDHHYTQLISEKECRINMNSIIPYSERIQLALSLLNAVNSLNTGRCSKSHTRYMHGDLHLKNLIISEKGHIFLIDFDQSIPIKAENEAQQLEVEFINIKKMLLRPILRPMENQMPELKALMQDTTIKAIPEFIEQLTTMSTSFPRYSMR